MRQMTMTQLFDAVESSKSTTTSTPIKQEPETPSDDTMFFMPESLIGLAQPSESMSDNENQQVNFISNFEPLIETFNFRIIYPIYYHYLKIIKHPIHNHLNANRFLHQL